MVMLFQSVSFRYYIHYFNVLIKFRYFDSLKSLIRNNHLLCASVIEKAIFLKTRRMCDTYLFFMFCLSNIIYINYYFNSCFFDYNLWNKWNEINVLILLYTMFWIIRVNVKYVKSYLTRGTDETKPPEERQIDIRYKGIPSSYWIDPLILLRAQCIELIHARIAWVSYQYTSR